MPHDGGSSPAAGANVAARGRAVRRTTAASDWAGSYRVEHLARIDEPTGAPVWAVLVDWLSTRQAADRVADAHRASTGKSARVIERQMVFIRGEVRTRPVDEHLQGCPPY